MNYTNFLLEYFNEMLVHTAWLAGKDAVYADHYTNLYDSLVNSEITSEEMLFTFTDRIDSLIDVYDKRAKDPTVWIIPKQFTDKDLVHDESGALTKESTERIQMAIVGKNSEKTLVSDTGKTISFDEKWYQMINSCSFKAVAVTKLTDFISKFIEADGWAKYFVGNIGKNNKRLIQEYHVMDKYNLNHGTSYAAMHLGGDTTKCVLVSVNTATRDGKGEPDKITFLEIGAHTIIDRFIVNSFTRTTRKPITEASAEELADLFDIN